MYLPIVTAIASQSCMPIWLPLLPLGMPISSLVAITKYLIKASEGRTQSWWRRHGSRRMMQLVTICSQLWSRKIWILIFCLIPVFIQFESPVNRKALHILRVSLPSSVKLLEKQPHRHTKNYVSIVTLYPVMWQQKPGFVFTAYTSKYFYISLMDLLYFLMLSQSPWQKAP